MDYIYDDGGRATAGYKGSAGDCVTRAIAIASGLPYAEVYAALTDGVRAERGPRLTQRAKQRKPKVSARDGVFTSRTWFKTYMRSLGFEWHPTMAIGTGCTVHLHDGELPDGRLVVSVSKHYTAVINGVIRDTHNPARNDEWLEPDHGQALGPNQRRLGPYSAAHEHVVGGGHGIATIRRRCVYGYWVITKPTGDDE